ncbi:MAG: glycosyltransferase family 9 protein [Ignavibacteriaceae bacterium]|nr:glycosyltransferase family 9 protein [Ignavibacteriaceae bacterium]
MKQIEIFLKNILLRLLLLLSKPNNSGKRNLGAAHSKILFIRLNRIGDALVTTPLLHLVKQKLNARIYVLADKKNHFIFTNNPAIDKVVVFNKGIKGLNEVLKFIKQENFDTIVDLHDDVSATVSLIIALSKIESKFGLEKENKIIYTKTTPRLDSKTVHVVDRILEIAKLFNINLAHEQKSIHFYPEEESILAAHEFISTSFDKDNFLVGINISAGSEARFWGVENFAAFVKFLLNFASRKKIGIVILCAPTEIHYANEIVRLNLEYFESRKIVISAHKFDEFAAIISKLNLLVTPDTSAVHLAAAFGVPVFGIYVKDTAEMIWSAYGVDFECITTSNSNLHNLNFETVKNKFQPFFEKILLEKTKI